MKTVTMIVAASLAFGCGGAQEAGVMTPEERLEQQLALADEQNKKDDEYNERYAQSNSAAEEATKFDKPNAEYELKRATLSAVTCPDSMPPEDLKLFKPGTAQLVVTFGNEGEVSEVTIDSNYDDTPVGRCVLQAIKPVRIQPFSGSPEKMDWTVELPAAKPKETPKKDVKKK